MGREDCAMCWSEFCILCGPVGLFDDCVMCWFVFVCDEVVPMTLSSDCNIVVFYLE